MKLVMQLGPMIAKGLGVAAGWLPGRGYLILGATLTSLSLAFLGGWKAHSFVVEVQEAKALRAAIADRNRIEAERNALAAEAAEHQRQLAADLKAARERAETLDAQHKGEADKAAELQEGLSHERKRAADLEARLRGAVPRCFDNNDPWLQNHRKRATRLGERPVPGPRPGDKGRGWKDFIAARQIGFPSGRP